MIIPLIVTLDGPAGVGKSTLAGRVAAALGIAYLDSGAMFRILAFFLGEQGMTLPASELAVRLQAFQFSLAGRGSSTVLACNGRAAGPEIRTEAVGMLASRLAVLPEVRSAMKTAQQALGRQFSLVAEGRDMGSVVFPDAPHKFFLDASPEVRALRRYQQLLEAGTPQDLAGLAEQIRQRDEQDRNRSLAPLRPADGAVVIDTSDLGIDEAFQVIMRHINSTGARLE